MLHDFIRQNKRVGILSYHQKISKSNSIQVISMPLQAHDYAQALYAALRELDRLQPDIIVVENPPATQAWLAINDRLTKATRPYQKS
jgi:L-threonylcarbamoyladenylate synthase